MSKNSTLTPSKKILILEDEKPMSRALELKLKHEGFQTVTAFDGESGLEHLSRESFDLVLVDVMMPKVNGFVLLEWIKKRGLCVPVIVLSNLSQSEDQKKAFDLGAKGFFIKSNTPLSDLFHSVQNLLKQ